jgi:hypothetical protein
MSLPSSGLGSKPSLLPASCWFLYSSSLKMDAACVSETSVCFHRTTYCYMQEDKNLKSYKTFICSGHCFRIDELLNTEYEQTSYNHSGASEGHEWQTEGIPEAQGMIKMLVRFYHWSLTWARWIQFTHFCRISTHILTLCDIYGSRGDDSTITVFWDVIPCSLVPIYKTTRRQIPEVSNHCLYIILPAMHMSFK